MIDGADITAWPQEIIPVFCEIARSGKRKASRRRPKGEKLDDVRFTEKVVGRADGTFPQVDQCRVVGVDALANVHAGFLYPKDSR